jgi:hypothetical protein
VAVCVGVAPPLTAATVAVQLEVCEPYVIVLGEQEMLPLGVALMIVIVVDPATLLLFTSPL